MPQSNLEILPLSKHQEALALVLEALKEEFERQQGMELKDADHVQQYLIGNTYVMIDKSNHDDVIGFFSLSRIKAGMETNMLSQALSFVTSILFGRMLIYDFCILSQHRKQGLGMVMMNMVEEYCMNNYPLVRYLELQTVTHSLSRFYTKCGFFPVGIDDDITTFRKPI